MDGIGHGFSTLRSQARIYILTKTNVKKCCSTYLGSDRHALIQGSSLLGRTNSPRVNAVHVPIAPIH